MSDDLSLLKALSDRTRLMIVRFLRKGERCACMIPSRVSRSQPAVSLQLRKLKEAGILESRRDGKRMLYSIKDQRPLKVLDALGD